PPDHGPEPGEEARRDGLRKNTTREVDVVPDRKAHGKSIGHYPLGPFGACGIGREHTQLDIMPNGQSIAKGMARKDRAAPIRGRVVVGGNVEHFHSGASLDSYVIDERIKHGSNSS